MHFVQKISLESLKFLIPLISQVCAPYFLLLGTSLNLVHVNGQLGLRKLSLQSAVSAQSRVEASRNSTVSIYLPIPDTPEEPTPLPFDERRKAFVLVGCWIV